MNCSKCVNKHLCLHCYVNTKDTYDRVWYGTHKIAGWLGYIPKSNY